MRGSASGDWHEESLEFCARSEVKGARPIAFARVNFGPYFSVTRLWVTDVRLVKLPSPR